MSHCRMIQQILTGKLEKPLSRKGEEERMHKCLLVFRSLISHLHLKMHLELA